MKLQFSIVIPVCNAAATLPDTLASVAQQSFQAFEVIVVDDGSTDHSAQQVLDWKSSVSFPVTLIQQTNAGLGAARNRGIEEAQNPWVCLLDADDLWEPERLQKLAEVAEFSHADVIYHSARSFGLNHSRIRSVHPVKNMEDILVKGSSLVPSATILRTAIARKFPFSEYRKHHGAEDLHLWLRLIAAGRKFDMITAPLTRYRETGGMSTELQTHLKYVFQVLQDLHQEGFFSEKLLFMAKQRKHLEAARFLHKRGRFSEAARHYQLAKMNLRNRLLSVLNRLGLAI